jgi:hypothetical protein
MQREEMEKAIQAHLGVLGEAVQATALPAESKHSAAWLIGRLPALYNLLRQTNESRYDDEMTRLYQALIKELVSAGVACPRAQKLAAGIPEGLRTLHEKLGLPKLALKTPSLPAPRRKVPRVSRQSSQ